MPNTRDANPGRVERPARSPRWTRSAEYWTLGAIVVLGACARLYHIDYQSIWHDEAISLTVGRAPLDQMAEFFRSTDAGPPLERNPPLYFLLLHGWFGLFGFGEFQARLLSAVAGVLALPLIFMLAERLYGTSTGLCAALLLAISQLGVMFSQEARNYEVFLVLSLATAILYWIAMTRRSLAAWVGCTTTAVMMCTTQYYGVFEIGALAVFTVLYWRSVPLGWVAGAAAAAALTLVPWLAFALGGQMRQVSSQVQPDYFATSLSTFAGTINRFNNGAVNSVVEASPIWTFLVGALIFVGPLLFMMVSAWKSDPDGQRQDERRSTVFTTLLWLVPFAAVLSLGLFFDVQFNVRYVAFCIGPYYTLAAAGLVRVPNLALKRLTVTVLMCYSAFALRANYYVPYKEDYRGAIAFIAAQAAPDDCYAFAPFGAPPLEWSIYASYQPQRTLAPNRAFPPETRCPRIWVITYQRVFLDSHTRWREWLSSAVADYQRLADRQFFWVRVELYRAQG